MAPKVDVEFLRNYPNAEKSFLEICKEFLDKLEEGQGDNFRKAGEVIGKRLIQDKVIFAVGTGGHTYMPVMDMVHRAGALVAVDGILDLSTSPFAGGTRSIRLERLAGYYTELIDLYQIGKDDVVIVFNNIGVNNASIEACVAARERGAFVIAVSSVAWHEAIPADHFTRHASKKHMSDVCDLYIDDYNPVGDSVQIVPGLGTPISPISTITYGYLTRRIEEEAIRYILSQGVEPEVFWSGNLKDGMDKNRQYERKYFRRLKIF